MQVDIAEKDYKQYMTKVRKKLKKVHIPAVERELGIPDKTLRRIRDGETSRTGYLGKLIKYFEL